MKPEEKTLTDFSRIKKRTIKLKGRGIFKEKGRPTPNYRGLLY
jgi:hypothetical protein